MQPRDLEAKKRCIIGHEFFIDNQQNELILTGRQVTFLADDPDEAVAFCLYTERLRNGQARIGPTGRTVYSGNYAIVFPAEKARV